MDRQFGRLFDVVRNNPKLRDNTLILICSDNGPEQGAGVAGPFRGYKTHLYEGGVRSSLIAWGPSLIAKTNVVNQNSVFSAIDLVPTLLDIAGAKPPQGVTYDGESLPKVLTGQSKASRKAPIFFRRPPDRDSFYGVQDLPDLAVRSGKWKLLCEYDGSGVELYDMESDRGETTNVARQNLEIARTLTVQLLDWHRSMPPDNGPTYSAK